MQNINAAPSLTRRVSTFHLVLQLRIARNSSFVKRVRTGYKGLIKEGKRERKRERENGEERRRKSREDDIQIIPGFVERREKLECFILLTKTWAK